ncbi:MAG: hypothetical protein JSS32_06075 [Verrucomicrobia bacterium]|nr:hypothetical protein [Verrucomicrobiota bacterium]
MTRDVGFFTFPLSPKEFQQKGNITPKELDGRYLGISQSIKSFFKSADDVENLFKTFQRQIEEFQNISLQRAPLLVDRIRERVGHLTEELHQEAFSRQIELTTKVFENYVDRHNTRVTKAEKELDSLQNQWKRFQYKNIPLFDHRSRSQLRQIQAIAESHIQPWSPTEELKQQLQNIQRLAGDQNPSGDLTLHEILNLGGTDLSEKTLNHLLDLACCVDRVHSLSERIENVNGSIADWIDIGTSADLIAQLRKQLAQINQRIAEVEDLDSSEELEENLEEVRKQFEAIPHLKNHLERVGTPRVAIGRETLENDMNTVQKSLNARKQLVQETMRYERALREIEEELECDVNEPEPESRWQRFTSWLSNFFSCIFFWRSDYSLIPNSEI